MPKVSIANKVVKVDDVEIPLISGEAHYWRLDPANWPAVLRRVREMGIGVIATYVCWDYHQVAPGVFDFTGRTDPRRNLVGYLDLLTREGFWIIFRPGPYIYSEWVNGGVPNEAARFHRLDPEFQVRAMGYMRAVTEAAKPYLATRGGRILLWQADNEIDPWPHWYTEQLGLGKTAGPFHDYLKARYGDIDAMNKAWESNYASIDQARAVTAPFPEEPRKLRRYIDFVRFQHGYVNRVADWTVNAYRSLGVDVPVYLNAYAGVGTQSWSEMEAIADLVGPDLYPTNEFKHRPNEHRHFLDAVRYAAAFSRLPYIAEFEAGIWHDWLGEVGLLSSNHYALACISALSAGAAGWNWYMLVNRDNWYESPINEWGRTRPDLFKAFQKMVTVFNRLKPYSLEKLTPTALTYDPLQRAAVRPAQALLQAFYEAGIDYTFYDTVRGKCNPEILFYAGGHWLSAEVQEKLKDYVLNGGHLVMVGAYPYLDENLKPYNGLGVLEPDGIMKGLPEIDLELSLGTECRSEWIHTYSEVPGEPITAKRMAPKSIAGEENHLQWNLQNEESYVVGYIQPLGRGKLTVLGLKPSKEIILAVHRYFGACIPARALTPGVQTACFRRDGRMYLTVTNATEEDKHAVLEVDRALIPDDEWCVLDLITGNTWVARHRMDVFVPRKNGTVLQIEGKRP